MDSLVTHAGDLTTTRYNERSLLISLYTPLD